MGVPLRVLVIEDSDDDATMVLRELRRAGYDVAFERVDSGEALKSLVVSQDCDPKNSNIFDRTRNGQPLRAVLQPSELFNAAFRLELIRLAA